MYNYYLILHVLDVPPKRIYISYWKSDIVYNDRTL